MEDNKNLNNGVKTEPDIAPAGDGIKADPIVVPPIDVPGDDKPDYEKLFYDTLDENARISTERDNYKTALLKNKKGDEEPNGDATALEGVQKSVEDLKGLVKTVIRENKELKIAISNKSQVQVAPVGSSGEKKSDEKEGFWTEDQIRYFQKKGIDPNKVKDTYLKAKQSQ